ncbi:MAG: sugar metabolism transcriptional regulator [Leptolyngbya sp. DLM2.Bin15]|nr:MAG: sugar metabolism transcriptional regulator [Leptolyngbya sp. DLM2.Bin15]
MLLSELQRYLHHHPRSSLQELSESLHVDADALRGMLSHLIRKGRVHQLKTKPCTHCSSCNQETLEFYEWVGR